MLDGVIDQERRKFLEAFGQVLSALAVSGSAKAMDKQGVGRKC